MIVHVSPVEVRSVNWFEPDPRSTHPVNVSCPAWLLLVPAWLLPV